MMCKKKRPPRNSMWMSMSLLLPFAYISFFSLGDFDPLNRLYAAEDARTGDDATNVDPAKEQREKRLAEMRRRAKATKVYVLEDGERKRVEMLPEPLMRFQDLVHRPRIVDATMWAWGKRGRPVATGSVELFEQGRGARCWYALESLSDGLIDVEWPDGPPWSSRKPGIEWHTLLDAPEAADGKARRMSQLKGIARRFSATTIPQEELSFLPQPVHRFSDPESGLVDGAMFAFTSRGLNADLLLVLELRTQAPSGSVWKYGQVRMASQALSLRLDGREVWTVPAVHALGRQCDTWLFFWSSAPVRF